MSRTISLKSPEPLPVLSWDTCGEATATSSPNTTIAPSAMSAAPTRVATVGVFTHERKAWVRSAADGPGWRGATGAGGGGGGDHAGVSGSTTRRAAGAGALPGAHAQPMTVQPPLSCQQSEWWIAWHAPHSIA